MKECRLYFNFCSKQIRLISFLKPNRIIFIDTDSDDDFTVYKKKGSKIIFSDTESDNDEEFMQKSVKPSIPKASTSNSTASSSNSTAPIASTSDSNGN